MPLHRTRPSRSPSVPGLAFLLAGLLVALATPAHAEPSELSFELRPMVSKAIPPLPPPAVFPVQLVLDDGTAEGPFGLVGAAVRQFMWFNSFADPGSVGLQEIWVLFPNEADVPLGGAVQLVVFRDPDGDPANGADLIATYDVTIQVKDGVTFSVYDLGTPLSTDESGDILVGVVSRYFTTGVDPSPTRPAALDTTTPQGSSYVALWAGDPPDPPDLATATSVDVVGGAATGNFMIRAFGSALPAPVSEVPALGGTGLALLVALLGAAGIALGRRRKGAEASPTREGR